ncbi:restriction endonuclease subunit S [Vibrio sinaloensis]|uniref:restriction endonuclease subunit S n=1 Tax=Photobacterium sp. (strain ATCC 43367) TaxID=379097 RepID=UPI0020616762|nr:restriction endonuclease subunit S [Vibrio sinaloensis]UPQ87365.1 restriction endonuclease subunit S [Vibrio sinaloensis]
MSFEKTPLNEFITLQRGFDLPKGDRAEGTVPVIASTGIGGYHNTAKVDAPGVVIGRSGSIGGGQYIQEPFWPLNTTLWVKDFKGHDPRYIYYLMRSIDFTKFNVGSGVPTLNRNHLSSLLVNELGIDREKAISKQLGDLDDKIALNTQTNQTLEQMAQAIFKSWFVDFDPVKAKMNGEQPKGMDEATASLFPEKLVESELGLIPDGWEVTKLSKVIDLLNGFAFKSPDYVKEGTFVLRTKNFDSSNSVERLGDDVYLPDEFLESHKKYLCEAYDYHVVMVAASIGKTAMIYPHQLPALRNQNMWCFRPKDESLRFYTKYMVDGLVKLNMGLASGSARAFFKKGDFNSYEFALPSSELLNKFNDVVGNLVKQKGSLLNQNVQLAAMRDTLLPKLLSGEIELGQAQELAEVE